jgi:lipooligosaccharide transport system ATP-binding protein
MNPQDSLVLSVVGLRKSYGSHEVVKGLDFAIRRGECFGLLGPNGAGRTTTLRDRRMHPHAHTGPTHV